jgi:hypothetical protein
MEKWGQSPLEPAKGTVPIFSQPLRMLFAAQRRFEEMRAATDGTRSVPAAIGASTGDVATRRGGAIPAPFP